VTKWKVLKYDDDLSETADVFAFVGEIEGRWSYAPPEAQDLGEKFGTGSFILLEIDPVGTSKYAEITIRQDKPTFIEVDDETAELDGVGHLDEVAA
jgi:hypothetical protein